jgi:hypothetical protein
MKERKAAFINKNFSLAASPSRMHMPIVSWRMDRPIGSRIFLQSSNTAMFFTNEEDAV